ncbi:MAG: hypothetical protein FWG20_06955, partial [Candidatus Cloacimonetes bacterium]|nr:hypothetical protein [Candidatus Cloacimonadota bacterium]
MNKVFIKMSDLRSISSKRAYSSSSNSGKVVKQLIGISPLNKEWVDSAKQKLKYALKTKEMTRIKYLINCLDILYFCDWILKNHQIQDIEINQMLNKTETLYINAVINYIEANIHNPKEILSSFDLVSAAVEVLNEANQNMSQKYKLMLSRYSSLYSTFQKINEICHLSTAQFNKNITSQISSLIALQETAFKVYPQLKENILEIVSRKLDIIHADLFDNVLKENAQDNPSIKILLSLFLNFTELYKPLETLCLQKRYTQVVAQYNELAFSNEIIEDYYQKWLKLYHYHSLPRNKIDEKSIISTIREMDKHNAVFTKDYLELKDLQPSFTQMKDFFISLLNKQGKDSIIHYYKIENDLLHLPDSEKKLEEIVRFIKHLIEKTNENGINSDLKAELNRIQKDFLEVLDKSIEARVISSIATNISHNSLKNLFDKILKLYYDINDLSKINYWQETKKQVLKCLTDVPSMIEKLQKDDIFMKETPESKAKDTLKEKLLNQIKEVNDLLPVMAVYQIGNVHEYIKIISHIEKGFSLSSPLHKPSDRMIVHDKYTAKKIIIFGKSKIHIGRNNPGNDIVLKCDWVSGIHCWF